MSRGAERIPTHISPFSKLQRKWVEGLRIDYEYVHPPCVYTSYKTRIDRISTRSLDARGAWGADSNRGNDGSNVPTRWVIPPGNLRIYPELHLAHVSSELPKNVVRNTLALVLRNEN